MSQPWHSRQLRQVPSLSISDCDVSGDDNQEPLFEGFSFSREGFDPAVANRRISILQVAKRCCLEEPARSPIIAVSSSTRGSCPDEVLSAGATWSVGLRGRVSCGHLDSLERVRPLWWSDAHHRLQGLRASHWRFLTQTFCYGPTRQTKGGAWISSTTSSWVAGQSRNVSFRLIFASSMPFAWGLYHFRHSLHGLTLGVFSDNTTALSYIKKRGYVFYGAQLWGSTPPPLGGIMGGHSDTSIYHGGQECRRQFSCPVASKFWDPNGPLLRMWSASYRWSGQWWSTSSPLPSTTGSQSNFHLWTTPWQRGRASGLCLSSVHPYSPGAQQVSCLHGDSSDPHRPVLASEGLVPGASESLGGSSGSPSFASRFSQTAPFSFLASEPPLASASCVVTVQRFTRHQVLSSGVANQLFLCRRLSSLRLYQHRWECYRAWCANWGHSVSSLSISKIADFLLFLRMEKHLSVFTLKGYRLPSLRSLSIACLSFKTVLFYRI